MTRKLKNLLSVDHLSSNTIFDIFKSAAAFKKKLPPHTLSGKIVLNAFFENSTRTRVSFETAAARLGAHSIGFTEQGSSVSKGESFQDTILNLAVMHPDAIVLRHAQSGAAEMAQELVGKIPVINAGDGRHEHPTQALLDAMTIMEHAGALKGLHVGIIGDIAQSRVARSNMLLLKKMGASVSICAPKTMIPSHVTQYGVKVTTDLRKLVPTLDVIMMLRIQMEREQSPCIPSVADYAKNYQLNAALMSTAQANAIVMHPGPMNRGVEIADDVANGPQSVILQQTENGVFIRMAVLKAVL
ncbi:MAG: aspartate carbamoyltransferase [Deltaproteobacteria bacterium CG11_big_fil_rev_8_21_14_0_20_47_16]|nr:MAG: aspartate carbamoyltransferase [Deltaproteobacteria bacterium CG11_big_fil_rev_8_21_14_0_20_47_16]